MKVVLATKNQGKLREFAQLASDAHWLELACAPAAFGPEETGQTFIENAVIKARAAALITAEAACADDSGLEVYALDGRPGVHSARYSGGDEALGRRMLLDELSGTPMQKRGAAYVCAMAVCRSNGEVIFTTEARWEGCIGYEERGENGFGFDPIFLPAEGSGTAAELDPARKNLLSHRGQAWRQVMQFLESWRLSTREH